MRMKRRVLAVAAGVGLAAELTAEAVGLRAFSRLVRSDVQALLGRASPGKVGVVTEDMLNGLPGPVQRYLRHTGIVGTPMARTVYLRQRAGCAWPGSGGYRWRPRSGSRCGRRGLSGMPRCGWPASQAACWPGPGTPVPLQRSRGTCLQPPSDDGRPWHLGHSPLPARSGLPQPDAKGV